MRPRPSFQVSGLLLYLLTVVIEAPVMLLRPFTELRIDRLRKYTHEPIPKQPKAAHSPLPHSPGAVAEDLHLDYITEDLGLFHVLVVHDVKVIEVSTASGTRWSGKRGARSRSVALHRVMLAEVTSEAPHSGQSPLWRLAWSWVAGPAAAADDGLVGACVDLYATDYGTWGPKGPKPGEPVRIPESRFRLLIDDSTVGLACAHANGELAGYCVAAYIEIPKGHEIASGQRLAWVSQLVVRSTYRRIRVATTLLYSIWQFSDCYAWGLVTANPFAVRALETATRRPCRAALITTQGASLLDEIAQHVSYVPKILVRDRESLRPRLDTQFFISHDAISEMRKGAARSDRPWPLGDLDEGQEWCACTFREQSPSALGHQQLTDLLTGADGIWMQAYERMTLDGNHGWHRHDEKEVNEILSFAAVQPGSRILDVGCGDGRHIARFANRGYAVVGVDIAQRLIDRAEQRSGADDACFEVTDARIHLPEGPFDLAICLYDVIGSSAVADDDLMMLRNIARVLSPEGCLVLSCMNACPTLARLPAEHFPNTITEFIAALEALPPSPTMEQSGSVFDPNLLLHYHGVFYRKEQFQGDERHLPAELVVRDRRFTVLDVRDLVTRAGFEIIEVRPVQAGHWDRMPILTADDERAKELLIVARRLPDATHVAAER